MDLATRNSAKPSKMNDRRPVENLQLKGGRLRKTTNLLGQPVKASDPPGDEPLKPFNPVSNKAEPDKSISDPSKMYVDVRNWEDTESKGFILELAKDQGYDEITKKIADYIGLNNPAQIMLTAHNFFSNGPKSYYIKYEKTLADMLITCDKTSDILYYEVLDIPLPEFERLKTLTLPVLLHYVNEDEVPVCFVTLRLPKQSTIEELIDECKRKVELANPNAEFRMLEISEHRITKIFALNEKIGDIRMEYVRLRAEEIPEEEKNLGPSDHLVRVFHFTKEDVEYEYHSHPFGQPFLLVIRAGEKLSDVKNRIQKKLRVANYEFCEWKFSLLKLGGLKRIGDDDILSSHFEGATDGPWIPYLGIEHSAQRRNTWYFPIAVG